MTTNLSPQVAAQLEQMMKLLSTPGTRLGSLVRRLRSNANDMQGAINSYGQTAIVAKVGNTEATVPLSCKLTYTLEVQVGNSQPQTFTFAVGPSAPDTDPVGTGTATASVTV